MASPRIIRLAGVQNFRDLGGQVTKDGRIFRWGRLFRSGHLSDMTDSCGMELLARDIETVIDFRSEAEKERHPVHWTSMWQPRYVPIPIGGNAAAWVHSLFEEMARADFPADALHQQFIKAFETIPIANVDGLATFFENLLANIDQPILFHCTAGKDRTGIASALLMRILGFDDPTIEANFLETNKAVDLPNKSKELAGYIQARTGAKVQPEDVLPLVGVAPSFLDALWSSINAHYGDFDSYVMDGLKLDQSAKDALGGGFLK